MIILLVILVVTFIFILGAGLAFIRMFSTKKTAAESKPGDNLPPAEKPEIKTGIRWSYFILPAVMLIVTAAIVGYFYGKLPASVAWRFDAGGLPSAWLNRNQLILWAFVPQVLLTLLAVLIAYGATKISDLFKEAATSGIKLDSILLAMSNVVIIPQLILTFTMLNIFSYNAYGTHIGFVWWICLAVTLAGIILLSIFFIRALTKMGSRTNK
jgi:uncharacterized membrane protein